MRRARKYLAAIAFAGVTALAAISPASALPFADGSIDFTAKSGVFTVDNVSGHISAATLAIHVPSLDVNAVAGNFATALVGATVTLSGSAYAVPDSASDVPVSFTITISGLVFDITAGHSIFRQATNVATHATGILDETYVGKMTNGGGKFTAGATVTLTGNCNENVNGSRIAPINCSYGLTAVPVPEPASLAILGVSLFGFGLIRRRRPTA